MNLRPIHIVIALILLQGCSSEGRKDAGHERDAHVREDAQGSEPVTRGPHGGRLFTGEDVALELRIMEEEGPPEFVAYVYDGAGTPLPPTDVQLSVRLDRFAGRRDDILFRASGEHLRGDQVVGEPHSFAARIHLTRAGREYEWTYEQKEGRIDLSPEAVASGGIEVATLGSRSMTVEVQAPGEIRLNGERLILVRPPYPGLVSRLNVRLGSRVSPGDTLLFIKSSESLTDYPILASTRGTIVSQDIAAGAVVDRETVLCTVADLSSVWVEFAIYPQHTGRVRQGQEARIVAASGPMLTAQERVTYVGPLLEQDTRSSYGRIVLANRDGRWQPGLYVTVHITVDKALVPIAVPENAIVRSRFGPAVFVADGSSFELQPIETGRSDGTFVEVTQGLSSGMQVVVRNAYVLKAELGKSEATHEH